MLLTDRRIATHIMVQPIDVAEMEAQALAYVLEEGQLRKAISPGATECKADGPHGYVETPQGIYALDNEGVGNSAPVTTEQQYRVSFYPATVEGHHHTVSIVPACTISLDATQLRGLAKGDKANLAEFIRSFGARLDYNYENWRRVLTEAGAKPKRGVCPVCGDYPH